ncbi:BCS1 N terminal-domain-containing protein [Crepidotus variabilis]|uniref:BCS1 N terminal-domain-containing protein n=1 Tax=Crepidotus variabilis TaxID=179855 RepID=A0A9P6ECM9_9AGAR|nr:BCS1 N terminal-domain-containing protein [Crepidotus variabilis]
MPSAAANSAAVNSSPTTISSSSLPEATTLGSVNDGHSFVNAFVQDNPYFQAGFGLMVVGVGLTALRHGITLGSTALRRRMLVTLEINNKDRSYEWFLTWMARQTAAQARAQKRWAPWARSHQLSVETTVEQRKNGSSSALFKLVAGPGTHYVQYKGAWMQVKRERETKSMNMMSGTPWETVTLMTLSRDRNLFSELLTEARDIAMRGQEGKLVIHTAWGTEWRPFGQPRQKRPLQSVVLGSGVSQTIENDLKAFLDRRQWYADRGIPYRRGYLLHGPPGSGKTSFIQALAGSFSYDICVLNLSERGLADDKLFHLLSNAPERSFVLIEDIDAAFNRRVQTSEDGYQSSVTFSGFLNALDGVASGEERIIFMTTNHPEKLDPALIRPGRVDLMQLIDDATPEQSQILFDRFYRETDTPNSLPASELQKLSKRLGDVVKHEAQLGRRISMAALQGLFIRNSAKDAIASCQNFFIDRQPELKHDKH